MTRIIPPSRPKRDEAKLQVIKDYYAFKPRETYLIFIRGYYLNTMGEPNKDDRNIYDDALFVVGPTLNESYNCNTNPSWRRKGTRWLAELNLGVYQFYRGMHKGRYKALRTFPEGAILSCTRNSSMATCSHINIHKGSTNPMVHDIVWSEGCLTLPDTQYNDFQMRLWDAMDEYKQEVITAVLLENRQTAEGQKWFSAGNIKVI